MPLYHVHIAASRHEPLPPVAELTTIEADSPEAALGRLRRERFAMSGGQIETVWLNVVVSQWPSGEARQVLSTEVRVEAIGKLN